MEDWMKRIRHVLEINELCVLLGATQLNGCPKAQGSFKLKLRKAIN